VSGDFIPVRVKDSRYALIIFSDRGGNPRNRSKSKIQDLKISMIARRVVGSGQMVSVR
jgi:hypothetical protein